MVCIIPVMSTSQFKMNGTHATQRNKDPKTVQELILMNWQLLEIFSNCAEGDQ